MSQEIKDLIEKINQEGIAAANLKAQEIESAARCRAEEILSRAEKEADSLLKSAQAELVKREEGMRILLSQAGRDLLLSLKKEINVVLERIIVADIRQSLGSEDLLGIIRELVIAQSGQKEDIVVSLKEEDLTFIEKEFLAKLKEEIKKGIILKAEGNIRAGFLISFDAGRSYYDFSDRALAEHLGKYVKPKLNELLNALR